MTADPFEPLRDALRLSPDNVPLRRHLADTLLSHGKNEEAADEYRQALARDPDSPDLKLGLASAFHRLGKTSAALVIVEDLLRADTPPARAHILNARLCLRAGDIESAVRSYKKGVDADPSVADPSLAEQLGIDAGEESDSEVVDGRLRAESSMAADRVETPIDRPKVTFADVGGMDKVKDEIRMKIILPLTHPELYKAYGKTAGGGILLYGPPGCGKTHLARATAGEVKAAFIAVGISDVLEMWIGQSERNLHAIFDQARSSRPCVLFFDEVDALGASRSDMRGSSRQLINQFLSELDGIGSRNEDVLILAATNAPWHLDPAFRRPGRFDRIIFVPPPDLEARAAILRIHLAGKPAGDVDHHHLAKKTEGFSGADLKAVVDVAVEAKLREALKRGVPQPITSSDLAAAAKSLKPSTKEWFSTARNYALYSNQGGIYDDILDFLDLR